MELSFHTDKERIAKLSDAELLAKLRDPATNAYDRMLCEAEIARRRLNPGHVAAQPQSVPAKKKSKTIGNLISLLVVGGFVVSILAGILDEFGIDLFELLREFFATGD